MIASLSLIILGGLLAAAICKKLELPGIVGMLIAGVVLGPYVLDMIDSSVLGISSELRQIALIIILIKAGLSLNLSDLKKVGRSAVMMSCVPAGFEILGYVLIAPLLLGVTRTEAAVMGAVMGAVSPAVVVPRMVRLIDEKYGTQKSIPQLIMAGASCDDIFVIVLFTAFVGMAGGGKINIADFADIPVSIISGALLGAVSGYALWLFFEASYIRKHPIHNSMKVIIILGIAFLLTAVETWVKNYAAVSGLLAVISMACVLGMKSTDTVRMRISEKFGNLWQAAEVLLFVLVGTAVNIRYTFDVGIGAAVMIFIALLFRAAGVMLCLVKTPLTFKERLFCVIAYLPKATVQAAIGAVPLAMGLPCGNIVLSVAVLAIVITAPLGALGIDVSYKALLAKE